MSGKSASTRGQIQTPIGVLPADWHVKKLGENAYIKARIGWRGLSADEYTEDGPLLVAGSHIKGAHIDWMSCDHISEFRYEESPEIQLQNGDVILSKDGTLGRIGIVESLPEKATINGTMMLVRPNRHVFKPRFIYYYLQGRNFRRFINEKVSGSSVPHIFQRDMVSLLVPAPPSPEQRKIAAILSSVDDAIEKTEAVIDQVQVVKRGLMQELLTRGLPGRHTRFKQTEIGELPEAWKLVQLGDVGTWSSGGTPSRQNASFWSGAIPWISGKDMKRARLADALEHVSQNAIGNGTRTTPTGSILIVVRGMILAHTFPVALTLTNVAFNQDLKALVTGECFDPEFLLYWLEFREGRILSLVDTASHGTKRLPTKRLFAELVPCPAREEQERISLLLRSNDSYRSVAVENLESLAAVKSALMSVLLTGELRVTPDLEPERHPRQPAGKSWTLLF